RTFLAPRSLAALFAAMAQAPDAILLAGGTDLGLGVSKDREALPLVISLEAVDELRRITPAADAIEIGGAVSYTDALPHLDRHFPSFGALAPHRFAANSQSRNDCPKSGDCFPDRGHHPVPDRPRCHCHAPL